jgi:dipeptidyl aminopeptidase/acylaminoacyl peptidase
MADEKLKFLTWISLTDWPALVVHMGRRPKMAAGGRQFIIAGIILVVSSGWPGRGLTRRNHDGIAARSRPATIADSITMTLIGVRGSESMDSAVATFSPDDAEFIVLTHRGSLEKNSNDYCLLLFHSADAFRSPRPDVLLTWPSLSNDPAISHVRWLADNKTILFLGKQTGQRQQVFSLNVQTRELKRLTRHPTDILSFDATADLRTIVYLARQPVTSLIDDWSRINGLVISDQSLTNLLIGHNTDEWWLSPLQLFVSSDGQAPRHLSFEHRESPIPMYGVSLSPDGRFAVLLSNTGGYANPKSWRGYKTIFGDSQNQFLIHLLVDISTGSVRPLINNAPTNWNESYAWSADGRSVLVGGTYLPLDIEDPSERKLRETTTWAAEVDVKTGALRTITKGNYRVLRWNPDTDTLLLEPRNVLFLNSEGKTHEDPIVAYQKKGERWERANPAMARACCGSLEVQQEQDMNTPARLFAVNHKTGEKALLLDPNPQFRNIRFGHVEEITWRGSDGAEAKGGLYLPPEYVRGGRYPLVIQAYGWNPQEFWMDGPAASGFAAQALAGRNIVVVQLRLAEEESTPREGPKNMAMREGLIDDLDSKGIIDRNRVGLMGFSRAGYGTRYTLAFSKYAIKAAAVCDGMDGGYWEYIMSENVGLGAKNPGARLSDVYEGQNGAAPFGDGLQAWLANDPSLNLHRVRTPVRLLAFGPYSFEAVWEWFVGLRHLGKPVELVWLPDAAHELVKPLERMTAQQGNVDWFCFWLKGEEDPNPAKVGQYARWRELRAR